MQRPPGRPAPAEIWQEPTGRGTGPVSYPPISTESNEPARRCRGSGIYEASGAGGAQPSAPKTTVGPTGAPTFLGGGDRLPRPLLCVYLPGWGVRVLIYPTGQRYAPTWAVAVSVGVPNRYLFRGATPHIPTRVPRQTPGWCLWCRGPCSRPPGAGWACRGLRC